MAHPFAKMFEAALRKSTPEENVVLQEAEGLRLKGYSPSEIYDVLKKLQRDFIADKEVAILTEAVEEFAQYID